MLPQPPRGDDPRSLLTLGRKSSSSMGSLERRSGGSDGSTFSLGGGGRWEPVESEHGDGSDLAALGLGPEDMEVDEVAGRRLARLSRSSGGSSTTLDVSLPLPAVPGQAPQTFDLDAVMSSPRTNVVERQGLQGDIAGRLSVFTGRERDVVPRRQRVRAPGGSCPPPPWQLLPCRRTCPIPPRLTARPSPAPPRSRRAPASPPTPCSCA